MPIRLRIARTSYEKDLVYRVRYRVFVEEEQRFTHPSERIVDAFDSFEETVNVLGLDGDQPVASIRVTNENPVGLPAFEHFDFTPFLSTIEGKCACVGWLCVLQKYRKQPGLVMGLFKMVVREMKKVGARHTIATIHPPIMEMLRGGFGARPLGGEFLSGELKVPMLPVHIDVENFPHGSREAFRDPSQIILSESNERRIYSRKEEIIHSGEPGEEAFLVMRGAVRAIPHAADQAAFRQLKGEEEPSGPGDVLLGQGQIFGELSLLDSGPRTTSVVPFSRDVDLMVWSREEMLRQLQEDKAKAFEVCKLLGTRLRQQIEGTVLRPAGSLLPRILLDASRRGNVTVQEIWLAQQAGVWPKDLQPIVALWIEKGWVTRGADGTLNVEDPNALETQAEAA